MFSKRFNKKIISGIRESENYIIALLEEALTNKKLLQKLFCLIKNLGKFSKFSFHRFVGKVFETIFLVFREK